MKIHKISLTNFRNLENLSLDIKGNYVSIIGANGAGKTSILEAVSLLTPGRGIRSSTLDEMCNYNNEQFFTEFGLSNQEEKANIRIGYNKDTKRYNELNGYKASIIEFSKFVKLIWLTPQMEGIFINSSSNRRKFLDRLTFTHFPEHARNLNKYEHYMQERNQLLKNNVRDSNWMNSLEHRMSEAGAEIFYARINVINQLNIAITEDISAFPQSALSLAGALEDNITQITDSFDEGIKDIVYENSVTTLRNLRKIDEAARRTTYGPHLSDLVAKHAEKNMLAKFCSTGEQKALLISIILSQISSFKAKDLPIPIVLLDEIFIHLDHKRRLQLTEFLLSTNAQIFVTDTEIEHFEEFASVSQIINL